MDIKHLNKKSLDKIYKNKTVYSRDFFYFLDNSYFIKNSDIKLKNDHTLVLNSQSTYIVKLNLTIKCKSAEEAFIGILSNNELVESYMEQNNTPAIDRTICIELSSLQVTPFNKDTNIQIINLGGDIYIKDCHFKIEKLI